MNTQNEQILVGIHFHLREKDCLGLVFDVRSKAIEAYIQLNTFFQESKIVRTNKSSNLQDRCH